MSLGSRDHGEADLFKMAIDYTSHPSELLPSGVSDEKFSSVRQSIPIESLSNNDKQKVNANVDIKQLREAIPPHCFERSYRLSLGYLFRDLILATTIMGLAFVYIPKVEPAPLRYVAWAAYGYIEGLVFVGLWVRDGPLNYQHELPFILCVGPWP